MKKITNNNRRLRRIEASKYLMEEWGISRSSKTLAKLTVLGGGPRFQKDGRFPLYLKADLDAWVETQLSPFVCSSAELAQLMWKRKQIMEPGRAIYRSPDARAVPTASSADTLKLIHTKKGD